MKKKVYNGLAVRFIPIEGANIITASALCEIVSVQYYVNQEGWGQCQTEGVSGGDEYSYNWNRAPH